MDIINQITDIFNLYYANAITKEERIIALKNCVKQIDFNIAISLLPNNGTLETVRNVILTGFLLGCYKKENEVPMRELLLQTFHNSHEDIVGLFQSTFNNSSENIPILLKALKNIPEYLQPDDFKYPYIRKIIYAIGAQPQPESLLALERLASETDDEKIKELALHQLEKRRRLGRWEQKQINGID